MAKEVHTYVPFVIAVDKISRKASVSHPLIFIETKKPSSMKVSCPPIDC